MKPQSRRSFLRSTMKLFLGIISSGIMVGTYSTEIERFWYQIKEIPLKVKRLPKSFIGWKIVHFSDVHLGFHYGVEEFQTVVHSINNINPDIIFFTGDLIELGNRNPENIIPLLKEIKTPPGGKWAVIGNHDYYLKEQVIKVLQKSNFMTLDNTHHFIENQDQKIYIAGIDDVMYGSPKIDKAIAGLSESDCVFLLSHEPDIADESSKYPISAQFSGHSHGGQVRLPFWGPIINQRLATKYMDGYYEVGVNKLPLYVNRGIGTTNLPIRLFCRPEITVFYLAQ
ncbi:metallophosphoesterase [Neobacillus cucumis]|uniref:metallophosphoesterase n=1 Tax=Neobacillus cucumis TaxID=1740721 RepID=UPI0015E09179|nr:metallophosphoesterase [Neobacillus cucumis]